MSNTTERFKSASWFDYRIDVNIIVGGAGGIGSNLAYLLYKSNINFTIIDFDTVEEHNIGGQFYKISDIGKYKVIALYTNLNDMEPYTHIKTISEAVNDDILTEIVSDGMVYNKFPIFVCAFDNMEARYKMYSRFSESIEMYHEVANKILFVDGRLSAEYFKYFVFNGSEKAKIVDYYKNHLKDDSEYNDEKCTFSQTVDVAMMLASKMSVAIKNHITNNISDEGGVKIIPYVEEYAAPLGRTIFKLKP